MQVSYRPFPVVTAIILGAVLSGCGGGSPPSKVASLSGSNAASASPTTTLPHGKPTQLLDEWAQCMRKNGIPNLADPTIDANGTIHITMPSTATGGPADPAAAPKPAAPGDKNSTCQPYLAAASTALRGGQANQKPDPAKLLALSHCMQTHGIPDFPDPSSGGGLQIHTSPGSDLNPNSPAFQAAQKTCAKSTGVPAFGPGAQRGGIEVQAGGGPAGGPAGGPGGGAGNQGVGG